MNNQEQNQPTPSPATDVDEVARGLAVKICTVVYGTKTSFTSEVYNEIKQALLTYGEKFRGELEQEKVWKEEDPRMLREQIRIHDVVYQHLFEQNKNLQSANEVLKRITDNAIQELEKCNDLLKNERRMYENASKERDQLKALIVRKDEALKTLIECTYCERSYQKMHQVRACPQDDCECCNCSDVKNAKAALSPTISSSLVEDKERLLRLIKIIGIERCEVDAGQGPSKEYWWNGYGEYNSMTEALDDYINRGIARNSSKPTETK